MRFLQVPAVLTQNHFTLEVRPLYDTFISNLTINCNLVVTTNLLLVVNFIMLSLFVMIFIADLFWQIRATWLLFIFL